MAGESSSLAGGALQGLFQLAGTGMQMASAKRQQDRNFQYSKELAEQQQQNQKELMQISHDWAVKDAKSADSYKVQSLQSAGLNPMLAYGGTNSMPVVGGSAASAPVVNYDNPMAAIADLPRKLLDNELVKAQISNIESQTRKNDSETEGNEINNTFLGAVNDLKIKLTNDQYNNAIYLQGYYADNPELLQAIADEKHLNNQNIIANYDNLVKNLDYLDSAIAKNHGERSYLARKQLSLDVQDMFTRENILYLRDQNLRENYRSPGWLIDEMKRVSDSNLDSKTKTSRLSLLSSMYDSATGIQTLKLQHQYKVNENQLHDANMSSNVDAYVNQQNKELDQRKTEFAWNKVFQAVDMTVGAVLPYYESHSMQNERFEHEERMQQRQQDFQHQENQLHNVHDSDRQRSQQRHEEKMQDRKFEHDNFMDDKRKYYDEHHPQYEDIDYYDNGIRKKKYRK